MRRIVIIMGLCLPLMVLGQWNNPHSVEDNKNTRYSSFASAPKTLDPAKAYSSNELQFISQIYEPLLQYNYFKRPYVLEPLTASAMPVVSYYDSRMHEISSNVNHKKIAYTVYDIHIKPGILFEAHPAFASSKDGSLLYSSLNTKQLNNIAGLDDFPIWSTHELTADDYVYEIKRIAAPWVHSPIYGLMSKHIVGLTDLSLNLQSSYDKSKQAKWVDLRKFDLSGVKVLSKYHFQIILYGSYQQFNYWLAMPFFAPIPWEVDKFYSQDALQEKNISLDWMPVGTGPYTLVENDPNKIMVLHKSPSFRGEIYPSMGEELNATTGHLSYAGQTMPFIDRFEFHLEKESIPRWNKFLQGYYDKSGISADSFDQAIQIDSLGDPVLTPSIKKLGIKLQTTVSPAVYYMGFNMLDSLVGGYSDRAKYLRQAISIAVDYKEYIFIFMNGRGVIAHGPIPPGIFGHGQGKLGINNVVYNWDGAGAVQKPLEDAKKLLVQAGYPKGIDPKTKKPLIINYDVATSGGPDDKARMSWMRKQFKKIGLELNIRSTQYNRFREKVRTGNAQIFSWGWLADYPDPENFIFLLYGPNGKVKFGGENTTNYSNPKYDALFNEIVHMPDSPQRQDKINKLLDIAREDSPWIWGVHPIDFSLSHSWNGYSKPNAMANNVLKYEKIDHHERLQVRRVWNNPVFWPVLAVLLFVLLLIAPLVIGYLRKMNKPVVKREGSTIKKRKSHD